MRAGNAAVGLLSRLSSATVSIVSSMGFRFFDEAIYSERIYRSVNGGDRAPVFPF